MKKMVRMCSGGHRHLKYMYPYLYMHMWKTAQDIVNSTDGKTCFSLNFGIVSIFTLCIYHLFKNYKLGKF